MTAHIVRDGIELRRFGIGAPRRVRFDDIDRIDGGAILVGTERIPLAASMLAEVQAVIAGPAPEGAALARYLAGPHGLRIAARALLAIAENQLASDLHLEPLPDGALARLRLEGELQELCTVPAAATAPLTAALKGMAGCLPYRSDLVQEGRIPRTGVAADIRASFVPTALGERVALRLFGRLLRLGELGLPPDVRATLDRALASRTGLLLFSGATGAGKTTTMYAALAELCATRRGAHLSLEDPVEQRLRVAGIPVDQVELDPVRGVTGAAMLAAALRQDIDVLSVGELRTDDEAQLALKAAHTGRLVLAGVHAGSCDEARQRMLDLGADATLLKQSVRAVLHQELVVEPCEHLPGSACKHCRGLGRRRRLHATVVA